MASSSKNFILFIALIFLAINMSFRARQLLQTTMPSIPSLPTIPTLANPTSLPPLLAMPTLPKVAVPPLPAIPMTLPQPTLLMQKAPLIY
ncbi:hypothetical protein BT93_G1447 [Corymbia citriodora subsp. variegata]|nr:hypothetical protein BT93_G1447 [Corymbia citriodora subsp. variegata]